MSQGNAASSYSQSAATGTGTGYWAQERSSEDDAYGGMDEYEPVDDYADSYMDDYYNEPSPPAPVASTKGPSSGYASPSSFPSKPSKTSPYQPYRDPAQPSSSTSPPTSPLQPPQLRHPSLSPSYRSSAASSYSTTSSSSKGQLGADLALSHSDQRSTWRSDITNADAFAFRDYESPAPPRVVITAPMTPPTKRISEVQEERWEETREDQYVRQEEEEIDMTVSPLRIRERELQQQPAGQGSQDEEEMMMSSSPSGRSRSMYNASNFSRPIRGAEPEEIYSTAPAVSPPDVEPPTLRSRPPFDHGYADVRPESMASVYSTASTMPALSFRSRADSAVQPMSILRTSAAYAESNRVLPPISPTKSTSPLPAEQPPTSEPPQPAQVVNRKPSIRFQDPRPPPPVPPPVPPLASSIQPTGALQRSASMSGSWLRRAAEHAVEDLELAKNGKGAVGAMGGAVQTELVLAIYEVGQCFFHGWGVKQDKAMAVSYFQVAAKLGDPDAQQELAFCLLNGKGCKKDKKEAAKWYRAAVAQGASDVGLAWIFKDKYM
ncbi:hypothetical protein FRC01_012854 [Tulasnella sp. 417]|nr:hypothetical protein FRC01_012854 [Tulasnella sp. 417]